jgi:hypothetical protein
MTKILFNIFKFVIKFWFPFQETNTKRENMTPHEIDELFSKFIDSEPAVFYEMILMAARQDKEQGINLKLRGKEIEDELMEYYQMAIERARKIEEYGTHDDRWRELASILRRVAQKIFKESGSKSADKRFLRLVK